MSAFINNTGCSEPNEILKEPIHIKQEEGALQNNIRSENLQIEEGRIIEHSKKGKTLQALLEQFKPINFKERAGLSSGDKISKKHFIVISIEEILEIAKQNNCPLRITNGFIYFYNGSYWKQMEKESLELFLGKAVELLGVEMYDARFHSFRNELTRQFFSLAKVQKPERNHEEVLINLQNGTFVIGKNCTELRAFNQDDFLNYQLPFLFDAKAQAPMFRKYLDRVLPDVSQQMVLAEFIAYVFISQKALKLEKSLILYGEGANGKSVFFDIINAMLGVQNVSNYSLQSLTNQNGYYRAKLDSKLLNYASEISPNMDSTLFKQLVSGEPIEARLPYGEPFTLEDYAKLIFNTNKLPKNVELNEAFFRRFIILHFGVTIPEGERNPELGKAIVEKELSGVFNWVLDGLERLLQKGSFTPSEAGDSMVKIYRQQYDSVQSFIDDSAGLKNKAQEKAFQLNYSDYKKYCREYNYKAVSNQAFQASLKSQGIALTHTKNRDVVDTLKKSIRGSVSHAVTSSRSRIIEMKVKVRVSK